MKAVDLPETFEDVFDGIAFEGLQILYDRQRKYGPKNIEMLGFFGVFDRLSSDKVERIRKGLNGKVVNGRVILDAMTDFSDESVEDALFDISNYALILIALKRNKWGRLMREQTGEVKALAGDGPVPQLTEDQERQVAEQSDEDIADNLAPLAGPNEWPDFFDREAKDRRDEEIMAQQRDYVQSMGADEIGPAHGEPV